MTTDPTRPDGDGEDEASVPPDVLQALTDEGIEHLMLSLQGPGIMLVDDDGAHSEPALEPTFDEDVDEPEPDSEEARLRMADLRFNLRLSGTARPARPREPPPPLPSPEAPQRAASWVLGLGVLALAAAVIALWALGGG